MIHLTDLTTSTMHKHLYLAQRYSAILLAPLVLIHLALIIMAVRHGLTAEEILGRTRGNYLWAIFYLSFVVAASIHAPIGIRNILREWTTLGQRLVDGASIALFLVLLFAGIRAVMAVI